MDSKRITDVAGIDYLWQVDNLYLAGQPSVETMTEMKERGVAHVYNLRNEGEVDQSEIKAKAEELGMKYHHIPIIVNGMLDAENCKKLSNLITKDEPHFIHCGSANRVGAWLITYLTQYRGMDFDEAVDVASENGLSNPGFIAQAQDVVEND
tara:strand:- start:3314 stop:3769 length:456 start_codon:yes stop_codon:yes gene_type:complete